MGWLHSCGRDSSVHALLFSPFLTQGMRAQTQARKSIVPLASVTRPCSNLVHLRNLCACAFSSSVRVFMFSKTNIGLSWAKGWANTSACENLRRHCPRPASGCAHFQNPTDVVLLQYMPLISPHPPGSISLWLGNATLRGVHPSSERTTMRQMTHSARRRNAQIHRGYQTPNRVLAFNHDALLSS